MFRLVHSERLWVVISLHAVVVVFSLSLSIDVRHGLRVNFMRLCSAMPIDINWVLFCFIFYTHKIDLFQVASVNELVMASPSHQVIHVSCLFFFVSVSTLHQVLCVMVLTRVALRVGVSWIRQHWDKSAWASARVAHHGWKMNSANLIICSFKQ